MKERGEDRWELLEVCQAFDLVLNLWKRNREVAYDYWMSGLSRIEHDGEQRSKVHEA
jgi:hypothetical protein